ncbi:EscU/YscU/HrcU family type III secretion system export apparatus switch protein [Microbacterium sp. zg.Y909]|uniref:EscU/YscU/HrcU family type III secretion system export apparatus switch protein n=1 Tax=Microbacterium sp. zg.Y909 TaxID=2969413 RepID=UPI00214C300F|nr:EscU/YscU/HrcU family type III secretion system export apparatus switch protein [Microbacterium sp. zg.Y909]MCR2824539.1 EscU/YscU/HrcU family type III secretion system export apparatus switch protein [Microbacterium sp. zg.Y909]
MSGGGDSGERTEKATDRRLREARRKGKLTRSQDFTAWLGIAAAGAMMATAIGAAADAGGEQFVAIASVIHNPDPQAAVAAMQSAFGSIGSVLVPLLGAVAVVTLIGAVAQGGVHLRGIPARFEQFNVLNGVKRIFGVQALWEGVKSLLKTAAIGLSLYAIIAGLVPVLTASGAHSIAHLLEVASSGIASLLITAVAVGIALAMLDVLVVRRRNQKHTRMTKKEARDEHKRSEGDPLIRGQRRARQLALSRNRMIAAVGDADVVLVNPTHVAVALRYEPGRSAPRVVAKGSGLIAERIRDRATEAGVPLVRDIPLARALHGACALGQEIPADLYTAVAQVLVFVDTLRRRGSARGVHTLPQRKNT